MSQRNVMFVDDDPLVLGALANRLRRHRDRWRMVFAASAADALTALEAARFDVIVSDLRMPGMDGAELLERVRATFPDVVRIVLSGHADHQTLLRALPFAHQYLTKPCAAEVLADTIDRACQLGALLANPVLREVVGRIDRLPSVPELHTELVALLARPDVDLERVTEVIQADPAMAAKVIQLASSACFGPPRPVRSIRQAVRDLGAGLLASRTLASLAFVRLPDEPDCEREFSLERVQIHSLVSARFAARIAGPGERGDLAYTAGLLHDVGRIVIALAMRPHHRRIGEAMRNEACSREAAELAVLGATHAEVGAYLLGMWGVSFEIVEAVARHHAAGTARAGTVLHAVRAGEVMAEIFDRCGDVAAADPLARRALAGIGLEDDWPAIRDALTPGFEELRAPTRASPREEAA